MRNKGLDSKKAYALVGAVLLLGSAVLATSCSRSTKKGSEEKKLVLTGSSTIAPLAAEIGKRFEKLHVGVRVDVQTGGSSRGIADARQGLADIGMASREMSVKESDLHAFPIARDGLCLITYKQNPVSELSDEQVVRIFTDRINNWKEVGGPDAPITVINKAEGRGTLEVFLKYFKLKSGEIKADVIIGDNEQGIKTVAGNPNAIGYVSIGTAEYDAKRGVAIRLLASHGVAATTANLASGKFPISRPLNLVTRSEPVGLAKIFIDFASSSQVHDLIRKFYFVPLSP